MKQRSGRSYVTTAANSETSGNLVAVNEAGPSEDTSETSGEGQVNLQEGEGCLMVVDETGNEMEEGEVSRKKDACTGSTKTFEKRNSDVAKNVPENSKFRQSTSSSSSSLALAEIVKEDNESCKCSNCPHLEELSRLKQENKQLLQQVQELQNQCCVQSSDVEIKFLNKTLEKKYKQDVENFIWKLLGKSTAKQSYSNKDECNVEACSDFYIDKKSTNESASKNETSTVPSYHSAFIETMDSENKGISHDSPVAKSVKATCFNCLGDHMLQECSVEKNRERIALNRQEYLNKSGANKQNRYHVDNELVFSSFKPGVLSKSLRHALGLHRKELPFFIYKMRQLGYPPGWLKEAEICSSGLTMYDSEGKEIPGEMIEDGEVGRSTDVRVQYDPSRLVDFPGFNVYPERGIKDKCRKYGFPPMQDFQLKHNVVKCMKAPEAKPYKRKTSANLSNAKRPKMLYEVSDMDIDEDAVDAAMGKDKSDGYQFASPRPRSQEESLQEISTTPCIGESSDSDYEATLRKCNFYSGGTSLEDLELARQQLMGQLKNVVTDSSQEDSASELHTPVASSKNIHNSRLTSSQQSGDEQSSDEGMCPLKHPADVTSNAFSASKSVHLGSPSIFQASKGLYLPGPEKFASGISEHIPFENLPDSTGQFQRMKAVLKKIKTFIVDQSR